MKLRPLLVPALLLTASGGLVAWLLLSDPPKVDETSDAERAAGSGELRLSDAQQPAADALPPTSTQQDVATAAPLPGNIRNVSPEGVTAPRVSGNLKRIEPSKRYLELKNPPVEPIPDGPLELRRIQVLNSGHLKSGQLTVTLAHIQPLKREETCVSRLGGTWPCGARAQTFLQGLIRQFKVTCEKIEELGPQEVLASCKRGKIDLASRLVRYGWADVAPGAPEELVNLALAAKEKKIGKWQSEWLAELSVSSWDDNPGVPLPGLEELTPEIVEWSLPTEPEQLDDQTLPPDPGLLGGFPAQ